MCNVPSQPWGCVDFFRREKPALHQSVEQGFCVASFHRPERLLCSAAELATQILLEPLKLFRRCFLLLGRMHIDTIGPVWPCAKGCWINDAAKYKNIPIPDPKVWDLVGFALKRCVLDWEWLTVLLLREKSLVADLLQKAHCQCFAQDLPKPWKGKTEKATCQHQYVYNKRVCV